MTKKKKKIEMLNSLKRLKILCSLNTRLNSLFFYTKQDTLLDTLDNCIGCIRVR